MDERDRATLEAMSRYGGSFVQALSEAAQRADPMNYARLRAAFLDVWDKYRGMAAWPTRERPADRSESDEVLTQLAAAICVPLLADQAVAIRLAKEATNGWACYGKRQIEHDEIARLHRAIAALEEPPA